ncbi:amino acid permease [Gluconacetobacter aggeris]|uniref:Amino acid permease n=1 Tax=Gluconacetobacter aggeris TaxID=1286186 RepID=A0A7W4IQ67_9PROT|nr:amino acid permease [Gluconacetobacter aggeris]MBB2166938.1 amino acid permease [Gluconacetobacter aggeris]
MSAPRTLRRALGPVDLLLLGVGCVVGAGIYILPGVAAAEYAGPAVTLSFLAAGAACGLTGICYAELSTAMPIAGASYSYVSRAFGPGAALWVGWMLTLEFLLAGAAVATGFASYLQSLLVALGHGLPAALIQPSVGSAAGMAGPHANLTAFLSLMLIAVALVRGVRESARVNTALVVVKTGVLLVFLGIGIGHVNPANWSPFLPPSEGGFRFGVPGVLRAASIVVFAYLGFDTVATAAAEARRPARDLPVGLIGTLLVSALLYALVSLVLTGLVPFRGLDVPDPVAEAMAAVGYPRIGILLRIGALTGLASVMLVNTYGHSRICFAMARDGLLPGWFMRLHPRHGTPGLGIVLAAALAGLLAALFPIGVLADLVSIGTMVAFSGVALSAMRLRVVAPDMARPFRIPLGGVRAFGLWLGMVPVCALIVSVGTICIVLAGIGQQAMSGRPSAAIFLLLYLAAGAVLARRQSRRRRGEGADRGL